MEEYDFALHKSPFHDAIALKYGRHPTKMPRMLACGEEMELNTL